MKNDDTLSQILRAARPEYSLPPGFPSGVWRRIRAAKSAHMEATPSWLEALVEWWLRPRFALMLAVLIIGLGIFAGVLEGAKSARLQARERYIVTVAPLEVR